MPYTYIPNLTKKVSTGGTSNSEAVLYNERGDHVNTPVTGKAELWVRNDSPNVLVFTDDAGTDFDISIFTGNLSDTGFTPQNAALFNERPDHVNTFPNAGKAEIWVRDDATQTLMFTDDAGTDHAVVSGPLSATTNAVTTFSGTTGKIANTTLIYASGNLLVNSATASIEMLERATPPSVVAGSGKFWVKTNASRSLPYFTNDVGEDFRLNIGAVTTGAGTWSYVTGTPGTEQVKLTGTPPAGITRIDFHDDREGGVDVVGLMLDNVETNDWILIERATDPTAQFAYYKVTGDPTYSSPETIFANLTYKGGIGTWTVGDSLAFTIIKSPAAIPAENTPLWTWDDSLTTTPATGTFSFNNNTSPTILYIHETNLNGYDRTSDITLWGADEIQIVNTVSSLIRVDAVNGSVSKTSNVYTIPLTSVVKQGAWVDGTTFAFATNEVANDEELGYGLGYWIPKTGTGYDTPAVGEIGFDAADMGSITEIYLNKRNYLDTTGVDHESVLARLKIGDQIILSEKFDPTERAIYTLTEDATFSTPYIHFSAVTHEDSSLNSWPGVEMGLEVVRAAYQKKVQQLTANVDLAATINQWNSWDHWGPRGTSWSTVSGGSGATPTLGTHWKYPGIMFPAKSRLLSMEVYGYAGNTTTNTTEWRLMGVPMADATTATPTATLYASADRVIAAANGTFLIDFTLDDDTIPANTIMYLFFRTTAGATVFTSDCSITITYIEEL